MTIQKSNTLIIQGQNIKQDDHGRFRLNDCHLISGNEKRNGPAYWLKNEQTLSLIKELTDTENSVSPVSTIRGGAHQGTYVVRELVYAYAMWISPSFHLQVIRAFDAMMGQPEKQIDLPKRRRGRPRKIANQLQEENLTLFHCMLPFKQRDLLNAVSLAIAAYNGLLNDEITHIIREIGFNHRHHLTS